MDWLSADDQFAETVSDAKSASTARSDLVSDRTDRLDVVPRRIVEFPVFVAFAGIQRTGVPTAHGDHDIDGTNDLVGPGLGKLSADVDSDLVHCLDDSGVDLRGRL